MKQMQGVPLPLGVTVTEERLNFSVAARQGSTCELLLFRPGEEEPAEIFPMEEDPLAGQVRCLALGELAETEYEYSYRIDGELCTDPYARELAGARGVVSVRPYDWGDDEPLRIPANRVIAYSLHVRGFTRHSSSGVKHKGTFQGVIEKLPYLTELGINQIHCMPVYEFQGESRGRVNYWGYGPGYFFAPKSGYAASGDGARELKDLVRACHLAGIEVVLEMPFDTGTSGQIMLECLRYYRMEYHVDGFILNPVLAPMELLHGDPVLAGTKLLTHSNEFQDVMRRFLKGDEGMTEPVMYWLNHHTDNTYNYITNQNGFTLNDLVSYDSKHNEANGENNQDGPDYNYSWNCGAEGPSRKKAVRELRERQMRNAMLLLLFSQGTPCILAGDEFGNTQKGNNNVYCQDNPVGWLDWSRRKRFEEWFQLVKSLIRLRKEHPVFAQREPLRGADVLRCGIPDISFHGRYAWRVPSEVSSRQLGVFYCGRVAEDDDFFVIYNMHWLEHTFALPALAGKKKWYVIADTQNGVYEELKEAADQHDLPVPERTIVILTGK